MPTTEWEQQAGMTGDIDTDNVQDLVDQAEDSKDAAAASETEAASSATSAASSATSAASSASSATTSASTATTKASEASASATNAANSATASATSATAAQTAKTAAETAQTAAEAAEANASTSEANAATSESNAATSEANASTSETNAAASATSAASSATTATTQASNASTSATAAATSATAASASETAAAASETAAAASESAAAASESAAAASESAASTSETNAANSASSASTSASQAATSATSAATSATNAAASYDAFDDRYLGAKASDPSVDNDGDALITGALYFDSTNNVMKVYDGAAWGEASSSISGIKQDFLYTATSGQTDFSGADDNAVTMVIDRADLLSVFLNGVRLIETTDYTVNASTNTVTLVSGATTGDTVEMEVFGNFTGQSGAEVNITGGEISGITSLGVDGTVTADGLTVDGSGSFVASANDSFLNINHTGAEVRLSATYTSTGSWTPIVLRTQNDDRLRIATNGDISFYEDTGTTPKFFWDASAESLGIGTSSPDTLLDLSSSTNTYQTIQSTSGSANALTYYKNGSAAVDGAYVGLNANEEMMIWQSENDSMRFGTNNTEAMRIDSSGNLLVGTTVTDTTAGSGFTIQADGQAYASAISQHVATLTRLTNDGDIITFRRAAVGGSGLTTVGRIGAISGLIYIGNGDCALYFNDGADNIVPMNASTLSVRDNAIDLGASGGRFDDIYATNGTIQTSDRNEKQDIEELSEAEQRVAVACKGLLRKFRWIDAVEKKDNNPESDETARIHFGIIAQDLQDAFAAEGLDAGKYAMFISTTWWETQTEVPAVEAVDAVLDDEGNVIEEAVEAKEAYTRTDTYDTAEEAPEGATERTRLGVRYPELLAFIIAAI
jgi:hypothetical protein